MLNEFIEEQQQESKAFKFWIQLLEAVQIVLDNIRAERKGIWQLHLETLAQMLPYMFAANWCNYARCLPVYILDMLHVPERLKVKFEEGQFAVRLATGSCNGIWTALAVEKTIVKVSMCDGGIIGITKNTPALVRLALTCPITSSYAVAVKERCDTQGFK